MLIYKCKMCNANLNIEGNVDIIKCEFCGAVQTLPNIDGAAENLVDRGYIFLKNGQFVEAREYFEKALEVNAKSSNAYLGKVLAKAKARSKEDFFNIDKVEDFDEFLRIIKHSKNYDNAIDCGIGEVRGKLEDFRESVYNKAYNLASSHISCGEYEKARSLYVTLGEYKDSEELSERCIVMGNEAAIENDYKMAMEFMDKKAYNNAMGLFKKLGSYKNSEELLIECKYAKACLKMKAEEFVDARYAFEEIVEYKDSKLKMNRCTERINERKYEYAKSTLENAKLQGDIKEINKAKDIFADLDDYKDSKQQVVACRNAIVEKREADERAEKKKKRIIAVCELLLAFLFVYLAVFFFSR